MDEYNFTVYYGLKVIASTIKRLISDSSLAKWDDVWLVEKDVA